MENKRYNVEKIEECDGTLDKIVTINVRRDGEKFRADDVLNSISDLGHFFIEMDTQVYRAQGWRALKRTDTGNYLHLIVGDCVDEAMSKPRKKRREHSKYLDYNRRW